MQQCLQLFSYNWPHRFACSLTHISSVLSFRTGDRARILPAQMTICSCEETINEFEMLTRDAARVQLDTLKRILEANAGAEYLRQFGLDGRTDAASYKSCIPLCVHSDVEPFIQRVADGDSAPVVTGKPITSLSLRYSSPSDVLSCCPMEVDFRNLFSYFYAVLVRRRGSLSSCHLMMNCLRTHFKYSVLRTHSGTGKDLHFVIALKNNCSF